jgi:NAD(P)-dependent dehydrogenase (short-subunit alcohol dehydrogenase family)
MIAPEQIQLTDQIALITGGGGGIGRGIAVAMARFGAHVVIVDKDTAAGERTAAEVEEQNRECLFVHADMMDGGAVRGAFEQADAKFGRLDILVNNVGGVRQQSFLHMSENSLRRHVDLNLMSMFSATAAAAPLIARGKRGGAIINITSSEGLRAGPLVAVYSACKAAMVSFTQSTALEFAGLGIRVNAIAPDQCATEGVQARRPGATAAGFLPLDHPARIRYVPLGRIGVVDDVAGAAIFLASRLSSYVTGIVLPVDGGTIAASGWNRDAANEWTLYMKA